MLDGFDLPVPGNFISRDRWTSFSDTTSQWKIWHKPRGCAWVYIRMKGAGGGGGGGFVGAASAAGGGGGGGGGSVGTCLIPAFLIPDSLYINIGRPGNGGASGAAGTAAIASYIAVYPAVQAHLQLMYTSTAAGGGAAGAATGAAAVGAAGVITVNTGFAQTIGFCQILATVAAGAGGTATTGAAGTAVTPGVGTCGGAGGGAIGTAGVGGAGGAVNALTNFAPGLNGGSPGGLAAPSGSGLNGMLEYSGYFSPTKNIPFSMPGSGGAGASSTGTTGGAGGNGGEGCGGGGGGAGLTANLAGAGGKGGVGVVEIITF